jgi:hypothetical protein
MDYSVLTTTLLQKLELENLPKEIQEEVITHIGDTILERTMLMIVKHVTEEEAVTLRTHLQEGDINAFVTLIESKQELHEILRRLQSDVVHEYLEGLKNTDD